MKIAVLGTGTVGQAIAGRLALLGHNVVIGTRDVDQTLARAEPDAMGHPPYATWQEAHPAVQLVPFPEAGAHGEQKTSVPGVYAAADVTALHSHQVTAAVHEGAQAASHFLYPPELKAD